MSFAESGDEFQRMIEKYLKLAEQYSQNFVASIQRGEMEKASEMLWGAVSCYANALSVLIRGKPLTSHSETVDFLMEFAKSTEDRRTIGAVERAQRLHVNFYHGFIKDREEFVKYYEDVFFLIKRLQDMMKSLIP